MTRGNSFNGSPHSTQDVPKYNIKNLKTIDYFLNRPLQAIYCLVSEALEAFAYVFKAELFIFGHSHKCPAFMKHQQQRILH